MYSRNGSYNRVGGDVEREGESLRDAFNKGFNERREYYLLLQNNEPSKYMCYMVCYGVTFGVFVVVFLYWMMTLFKGQLGA